MAARYHVRSISLPYRSHPTTVTLEEELRKAKFLDLSSVSTSGSIRSGLSSLDDLYTAMDELLNMTSTQQLLSSHGQLVDELLDGSVRILDVCGILRDLMVQVKECVRSLQSALRRRKGDCSIETSVAGYNCLRKKLKKDAKKLIVALKRTPCGQPPVSDSGDHHLAAVIRVLREVSEVNVSTFQSVLIFLSAPAKGSKWSFVSKMVRKVSVACEEHRMEKMNELDGVDSLVAGLCRSEGDPVKMKVLEKRLEGLEKSMEGIENELEGLFRRLIKTRTSLLNTLSQ